MISLMAIFLIILFHFIGDFILQSDRIATRKSSDNIALFEHCIVYTCVWVGLLPVLDGAINIIKFMAITFVAHTITDYMSSRICGYYYNIKDRHNFFIIIGLDQLAHYYQLFLTYYFVLSTATPQ